MAKRAAIEAALHRLAPRLPSHEFAAVVDHAVDSPGLRSAAPETAAWLSLVAYVRHVFTDYDELLRQGYDAESAASSSPGRSTRCWRNGACDGDSRPPSDGFPGDCVS